MWENRIHLLCQAVPGVFDELLNETDEIVIFQKIKKEILNIDYWEQITQIFSPIILHIVSEICLDCISDECDELPLLVLISNLIHTFPSIEPLIHFLFSYKEPQNSSHVKETEYLRALFRIRTIVGPSIDIKISPFLKLMEEDMPEEAGYYLASLVAVIQESTEKEAKELISSKCGNDLQTELFFKENDFISHEIKLLNCGPMSYETKFAISIEGVPFLKSLSSNEYTHANAISPYAKSLALAMLTNKPVLVTGPAGSGKTTLIQHLASLAGVEVTSLHLGSAVDAKSLLGGYICGEIPGEFRWMDGPLTSAIRANERWIVLEQIEEASVEVMSLLSPLLTEKKLFIPGRSETIKAGYNTRIFATSFKQLESSLWTKIKIDFLEHQELVEAVLRTHPKIKIISDRIISSWEACNLTYHELFRCCRRLETFEFINGVVSNEVYLLMYRTVVDTFTSHLTDVEKRLENARKIATCWDLPTSEAEAYLLYDKPKLILDPFQIGSISLPILNNPIPVHDFAQTFTSLHHMESVGRAISMGEPVLLVGETGTGKTTLVQYISNAVGEQLKVINMHHQSDTLDILGGFKPVDLEKLLKPINEKFHKLFTSSFSKEKNIKYINLIDTKYGEKQWESFLKGVVKACQMGLKKNELSEEIKNEWKSLQTSVLGFLSKKEFLQRDFAFGFVEGPLANAYREGKWILLDEVNLAPPETLLALAPIIDGQLTLPNGETVEKHPNFRLFCCMNPATDVGKVNLPDTLKHKFVSIFTDETCSESDIKLILEQRKVNLQFHQVIYDFYIKAREMSKKCLVDGGGQRVLYSLRALTRAILYMNKAEPLFGPHRACYDALSMSFASPLSPDSSEILMNVLNKMIQPIDKETKSLGLDNLIEVEGYYLQKGPKNIKKRDDFILTPTIKQHLRQLAQAVFLRTSPVLLQGPTSSGKTSIIEYLADITGHEFVRINNHEHTDMSEYIGGYSTSETGKFEFVEGALVRAVRSGAWVVLDELNLAPSDVLEALNRLLDQNNQLYIAETQTIVDPAPSFMLFATQNPPGLYGGRKQLSRAFRGRFVEIHVDEIPPSELVSILVERCHTGPPFAKAMVNTLHDLRAIRQFSQVFAGKHSFLTVRELLRWAMRGPNSWQEIADEGFAILGERLRTQEERNIIEKTLEKNCKSQISFNFQKPDVDNMDIVWTSGMIRSINLLMKCVQNKEPALLVGETGTGKTTAIQVIAKILGRKLRILNCHQHTETSDFIGAMRPSRNNDGKLFEWIDGSLVNAMKDGDIFLMDEISLAQDSALERLNSVLEPGRTLAIAEKPEYEIVHAHENFFFVATMNPGGDYGKRELSPSLRNRFTEIWVPSIENDQDLLEILAANSTQKETKENNILFLQFVRFFTSLSKSLVNISLRDILQWIRFVDLRVKKGFPFVDSYFQGAFMIFIDCVPGNLRRESIKFISKQVSQDVSEFSHEVYQKDGEMYVGEFCLPKGPNFDPNKSSSFVFNAPTTSQNLLRVGRALQMPYPVLIEGPPGVGKTSLIASLGETLGFNVVRINLSEHTEMLDLVGSELPVEDAGTGSFAWRDGAFLTALKNGDWVILDELNLASQSVLEGLNSCLDHRAALFVPELGKEFKCHPQFKIFGCQNPAGAGHGRKSLPRSFLNRFTRVYVDELTANDFEFIISNCYKEIPIETRKAVIKIIADLNDLHLDFEFNLRDVFRCCELLNNHISLQKAVTLLFIHRLRTDSLRKKVLSIAYKHIGQFDPDLTLFTISPELIRIGDLMINRSSGLYNPTNIVLHPSMIQPIESILTCAIMKWPSLIVGSTATGKSSLIRLSAHLMGRKLVEFTMNSSVDTTELLGGFEQMDNHRCFEDLRSRIRLNDAAALEILESITTPEELCNFINLNAEHFDESIINEANELVKRKADPGRFEWVDGLLLQAMRNGWWIIIDNANLCPPAVLDRLNPLCEPNGYLSLNERGIVNGSIETIIPHENFRLFMTVDPHYGEISRAMRNRSIEMYLPSYHEKQNTKLLIEECRSISNEYGEDFYELMKQCEHQDLIQLSAWNMISFAQFKKQTAIAQLGPDAVHYDIVHCELTKKQSKMTRSNSSLLNFSNHDKIYSPFRFLPVSNTKLLPIIYDAQYILQKDLHPAAIKFFVSQSRDIDFNERIIYSAQWDELYSIMRNLESSSLLHFVEDLPLDPLTWPKSIKTNSFTALYLLITLNLNPMELNEAEAEQLQSIEKQLELSTNIQLFFSKLFEQIRNNIQSDLIDFSTLIMLRAIDSFNKSNSNSLPLYRFMLSLLKKNSNISVDVKSIKSIICPNNSSESKEYRKKLGEPFSFKSEQIANLWNDITSYYLNLFETSEDSFLEQSSSIISMLSALIYSQSIDEINEIKTIFEKLKEIKIEKPASISFIEQIENNQLEVTDQFTVVDLTTPYPTDLLQEISIRSLLFNILDSITKDKKINMLQRYYNIPLELIAFIDSFNKTNNIVDVTFVLFELVNQINKEILVGPSYKTLKTTLRRHETLLQSAHLQQIRKDIYQILSSIPSLSRQKSLTLLSEFVNKEAKLLSIENVEPSNFKETFSNYAHEKWSKISSLTSIDDSYYHMIVSQFANKTISSLENEREVTREIISSRIGNENCAVVQQMNEEIEYLVSIYKKSIDKSKYRGNVQQYTKIKSIIERIPIVDSKEYSQLYDESCNSLLFEFPNYRDITVPLISTLRELSFAINLEETNDYLTLPFPFTGDELFKELVKLNHPYWPLTFSLIGRTNEIHPPLEFQLPQIEQGYHTEKEEEKIARQIEELFSKQKKDELNILAANFVESILNPDEITSDKLLKLFYKQLENMNIDNLSIESDTKYLPLLLYMLAKHHNRETKKEINIYQSSSTEDIEELLRICHNVLEIVKSLWQKYPGHDTLRRITKASDAILKQEIDSPLNNFLEGLEQLMNCIRDWQNKERDFGDILPSMVKLANKFLRMRLKSWKQIFETRRKVLQENIGRSFYTLLAELSVCTPETIPSFFNSVRDFLEKSPIGLLESNIKLVEALAIYSLRFSDKNISMIFTLLINVIAKFRRFLPTIEKYISGELTTLQKKMNDFVSLQNWDNNSDKKHFLEIDRVKRQLNGYCQEHLSIISLQLKLAIEKFSITISQETTVPYGPSVNKTEENHVNELDKKCDEILNEEIPLSKRVYSARFYATNNLEISASEKIRKGIDSSIDLYGKYLPLYGEMFEKHNLLFGELLILLNRIRSIWAEPHQDLKQDSHDILALTENMLIYVMEKRSELYVEPFIHRNEIKFVLNQIVLVLESFSSFENDKQITLAINNVTSLSLLQNIPLDNLIDKLKELKAKLKDNYVHESISMFIDRSIEKLLNIKEQVIPKREIDDEKLASHLSLLRYAVASFRVFAIALADGYGENNDENENDGPQECEGTDGVGLGEGKGEEDITNEIEDEDQLVGDNVNTNKDQQTEEDVQENDGFEVEQEPEGAADVDAHEEEDQMNDEMGEADKDEAMDSRETKDDSKEADKEADLDTNNKEEKMDGDEKSGDNSDDSDDKSPPQNGEMELEEIEEDQFESEAAEWNEDPEEVKMDVDDDRLIDNNSEGEEESINEEVLEEIPPDIEDEKDEFLGMTAPDKANEENEDDQCDDQKMEGEGKGDAAGEGSEGENAEDNQNEEEEESKENEKKEENQLNEIEKQLQIVERKLLKNKKLKEGGEGGERDDDANEGIILPADEAQEHEDDKQAQQEDKEEDLNQKEGEENEFNYQQEYQLSEENDGITHLKFEEINKEANRQVNKKEVITVKNNITEEGRNRWQNVVNDTKEGSADLCEQLRLVLEATVAAKMRGDFRTGKRINIRKIIPFIASGFRKDKIWMRRVQPDQRNYQILLGIDNSESMKLNAGELALQSVCLITQALTLLGIGDLSVVKFGENTEIVHPFGEQWNDDSGAMLMESFHFDDKKTEVDELLEGSITYLESSKKSNSMQIAFIISDGYFSNKSKVRELVIQAQLRNILIVFVIIDRQNESRTSIIDLKSFVTINGKNVIVKYLDDFPFPYYVLIHDPKSLPTHLADVLRQWFDLANSQ